MDDYDSLHDAAFGDQGHDSHDEKQEQRYRFAPGGDFILDLPAEPPALWGEGENVLHADGEALILAGPQGTGKTTLGQQLALGRAGFSEYGKLLDHPVQAGARRVLYLAMDRPRQAARSFRRMVGEAWRDQLNQSLSVWQGPPPLDIAKNPVLLSELALAADADTVVVDSIKDAAVGITDDEVGAGWNRAVQGALVQGVQVIELHHLRKTQATDKTTLEDLYGSTWITAGAGSVLLLAGSPGDPIVTMRHLKQPANEIGPLQVLHDQDTGMSSVWHQADLVALAGQPGGVTAVKAAEALFDAETPTPSEKAKARRKLDRLANEGHIKVTDEGDQTTNSPRRWGV